MPTFFWCDLPFWWGFSLLRCRILFVILVEGVITFGSKLSYFNFWEPKHMPWGLEELFHFSEFWDDGFS